MAKQTKKKFPDMGGHKINTLNDITVEVMTDDVLSRTQEDIQWLRDTLESEQDGKRLKTFAVRKLFLKKFYPDYAPKETAKKETVKKSLERLNAALK